MKNILLYISFIFMLSAHAQCPQRYRDKVFSIVNKEYNINYGGLRPQIDGHSKMLLADLYEPKDDTASLRPVVFMLHDGGFLNMSTFNRQSPNVVQLANDLALRGYVVISAEYRLAKDISVLQSKERISLVGTSAFVDVNDFICFFTQTVEQGNPYKIDTSNLFLGGVSAGAFLTLNGLFNDDTTELDAFYRNISNKVAAFDNRNMQEMMQNKFCGANIKGAICVSGALLDTNFIKPKNTAFLLIHGTDDSIIPFGLGSPFLLPNLPKMYGSSLLYEKMQRNGIEVEYDFYPGLRHIPYSWLFDTDSLIANQNYFNEPILDSTRNHIANFCYRLMGKPETQCDITSIQQNKLGEIGIFPNPNNGSFVFKIPENNVSDKWLIQLFSIDGQLIIEKEMSSFPTFSINEELSSGIYFIKISSLRKENTDYYLGKFTVEK